VSDCPLMSPHQVLADEGADGGVVDGGDVRGVSRPRRRGAGEAWSLGWRVGRQGGGRVGLFGGDLGDGGAGGGFADRWAG
jgi:hypothetical protein